MDHRFAIVREETESRPQRQAFGSDRREARRVRRSLTPGTSSPERRRLAAGRQVRQSEGLSACALSAGSSTPLRSSPRVEAPARRPLEALGDHVLPPDDRQHLGGEARVTGELAVDDDLSLLEQLALRILSARGSGGAQEKPQEVLDRPARATWA